jgi:hypothetical protein
MRHKEEAMDIVITLDKKYKADWKHTFEKELDKVMIPLGFSRSGSGVKKDGATEIYYRQFGVCLGEIDNG